MLSRADDPLCGGVYKYLPVPSQKYYLDYNTYDPLSIYEPWNYRYWRRPYYSHYFSYYDYRPSFYYDYDFLPSSYALSRLRVSNDIIKIP